MFKIFGDRPATSHIRSKTLPYLPRSSTRDILSSSSSLNVANGINSQDTTPSLAETLSSTTHNPTEPSRSHQRTLRKRTGSSHHLSPLISPTSPSASNGLSHEPTHLESCQLSPEHSWPSSPSGQARAQLPSVAGGRGEEYKTDEKSSKLANWFKGESERISIGILPSPTKDNINPAENMSASSDIRPTDLLQRKITAQQINKPALASCFSLFTSSKTSVNKSSVQASDSDDGFLTLDTSAALRLPSLDNHTSPGGFKALQEQAENLLTRLQTAYKERTTALHEMTAEKEALAEESQLNLIRAKEYKTHLDNLSSRSAEQDLTIMNLIDELAREKAARREEDEARKRTLRLVSAAESGPAYQYDGQMKRELSRSNTISDSGFESEDESMVDSIFSVHSPTMSQSSFSTCSSPDAHTHHYARAPSLAAKNRRTQQGYSNIKTGMIQGRHGASTPSPVGYTPELIRKQSCGNCDGVKGEEAWGILGVLKGENRGLKERVGELEVALDGCLEFVGRLV